MYDYLIVGAGLFGATFARLALDAKKTVLIIDKHDHVGGNCYTREMEGINVHVYGPHIFHTSDERVWSFVNRFASFNDYVHRVKVINGQRSLSVPINMNTFHQVFGVETVKDAEEVLLHERVPCDHPRNLEEHVLAQVGPTLYDLLIYGYTKKQWGKEPSLLPTSIINRLPVRLTWDDAYFSDVHQGIPVRGYTNVFGGLLEGADVVLGVDYLSDREAWDKRAKKTLFTGCIDRFYGGCFGELEYRSLRFEHDVVDGQPRETPGAFGIVGMTDNHYQDRAQVNYASLDVPWTRIVEHKHFERSMSARSIVTREYPMDSREGGVPSYPIRDEANKSVHRRYLELASRETNVLFGGRLADYAYRDMAPTIASAMKLVQRYL